MSKIVKKKPNRTLSEIYLDKISGILRDRWAETQQAMQQKNREEKLYHDHFH